MGRLALAAVATSVGLGSGQMRAAELVAVVEAVEAGRPNVAELEPLEAGQLVPLARGDRIVVGYLDSCAREVIAGPGAVRIGTSVSRLEGASLVDRRTVDCHGSPLAGIGSGDGAATRVRGVGLAIGPGRHAAAGPGLAAHHARPAGPRAGAAPAAGAAAPGSRTAGGAGAAGGARAAAATAGRQCAGRSRRKAPAPSRWSPGSGWHAAVPPP